MIVISNSSPLIALSCLRRLDIFQHLFGQLYIPRMVYQEVVVRCPNAEEQAYLQDAVNAFMTVISPTSSRLFSRNLGQGEQGVLHLALDMRPDILLIDDKRARNEAFELGFFPTFTTDILKYAEQQQLISSYQDVMLSLFMRGMYLPE